MAKCSVAEANASHRSVNQSQDLSLGTSAPPSSAVCEESHTFGVRVEADAKIHELLVAYCHKITTEEELEAAKDACKVKV